MYADPSFNAYMEALLDRLQRFANAADEASRARAVEAFVASARYRYMFLQTWPASESASLSAHPSRPHASDQMNPSRSATIAARVRSRTSSLAKMLAVWFFTVPGLVPS